MPDEKRSDYTFFLLFFTSAILLCTVGVANVSAVQGSASWPEASSQHLAILSDEIAKIGTINATLMVSRPLKVFEDLTIPDNIRITIDEGGTIDVAEGKTLVLSGPFEAPGKEVFTGPGKILFTPSSTQSVSPEWWGGKDRSDDSFAIQSAIDSISKGDVLLSEKTYLLGRRVEMKMIGSHDKVSAMLIPKSGVNIVGRGYGSILKVEDNHTTGGDYVVFAPAKTEATSDIRFSNFRIDGNGSHNLVSGQIRRAMAIWLYTGKNITINKVRFENHPGTNVVKFGSDSLSYLVTDSMISNCTFSNVGGAIPGNRGQNDHSTLYISGRNITVENNWLSNPNPYNENGPPVAVVAGIEMHGDNMIVSGNHVENYGNGGYIVGDGIVTAKNQNWTGNSFINMTKMGVSIWSVSPVEDILIEKNRIRLNSEFDQCVAGVFQPLAPPDTTVGIDGLSVRANVIDSTATKPGTVWNGIMLTAVRNAVVEENMIDRISGAGILVIGNTMKPLDCRNIKIRDNHIRDTSFNKFNAYPFAIDITNEGQGRFEEFQITGNTIESTIAIAENMGGIRVQGKGLIDKVHIEEGGNRFVNLKRKDRYVNFQGLEKNAAVEPSQH